ncbi:SUKH-4 family immunity protein [Streptomyces sp. CBMA152]|uniref:SUKH-4 family immunity protein n=1 Tax=Streptomyces sp. CBMA152 TaxID=1896312 RepID=UPI0016617287|nr:SUKH-4 family immunity protein [Streptomyces sp. CBMA152]MBD0746507.1 hypothetical protein [Streptomyces sp. CBMA152]
MVTFAQAQERAEEWINGDVPAYQHREVQVREFELGFVVWAEDRADGPSSDGGRQRLVIARDSGEATLWPGLPVGEVIRRYEEEYGVPSDAEDAVPAPPPERIDLNQTSFLLTPPEWLQEAADRIGIPDRRGGGGGGAEPAGAGAPVVPARAEAPGAPVAAPQSAPAPAPAAPAPVSPPLPAPAPAWPAPVAEAPAGATPWAGTDTNAGSDDGSVPLPATVFAPPLSGSDADDTPPPRALPEAKTALLQGGSQLPPTAVAPALDPHAPRPGAPVGQPPAGIPGAAVPGAPVNPVVPANPATPAPVSAADIAEAATSKAPPPRAARGGTPPPPSAPGVPGAPAAAPPYVPTQLVSQLGPDGPQPPGPPTPPPPGGGVHHAATMLADPSQLGPAGPRAPQPPGPPGAPGAGRPGAPQPPGPPGVPGAPQPPAPPGAPGMPGAQAAPGTPAPGAVHQAATMLAGPAQMGPGAPQAPGPVPPPAYGYPQQQPTGLPTVGPGYQAVLRYRAADGSEQQLIRRSAPGIPHPEWQIFHELRGMNVPPDHVLELHTELASCELPGGYCARMIRETWPQVRITSVAPYGTDHASRRQGVQHLLTHQGELAQVADGPARPQPVRAPLPQVQPAPPLPPEGVAHELGAAFGPQGVFRFDQRAVSRQGVPEVVAMTLMWAGLPVDFGPFFWAQAVPGQPVPTLAELAAQRQVQAAPDAGSYLVMGSDFGRAICVQYGTANIVAVPVEAGPGGQSVPPQFVNSGLPEFVRCMALLGTMWRLRYGLNPEQAGRWTVDFQAQLAALDPAALASPESWWSVLLEQFWDGLL